MTYMIAVTGMYASSFVLFYADQTDVQRINKQTIGSVHNISSDDKS